jgi:cation diffusion facilitator CzcD-associated flavoprotein CzcO
MTGDAKTHYEVIVVGAGVAGIYQIKRLVDLGIDATVLDSAAGLGGTWYWNRYPGCRFDSESYTYGFSFSREMLDEWHWKERFSGQPENLRYLNYVADKFDLRKHMQFNCKVEAMHFDEVRDLWQVKIADGRKLTCRFVVLAIGLLSAPTMPRLEGIDDFKGRSFHTYYWPPTRSAISPYSSAGQTGVRRSTTARSLRRKWPTSVRAMTRSSPPAR